MLGGEKMVETKEQYVKPLVLVIDESDILAIEEVAACSGCQGRCHRGGS